jgi:hypothetical protein
MYRGSEAVAQPNLFSLFREVEAERQESWWSEDTSCKLDSLTELRLLGFKKTTQVKLETLTYRLVDFECIEFSGNFLQVQFPDGIELVVSRDRCQTPYYGALKWTVAHKQITRTCSLLYLQPDKPAEILAT